MKINTSINIRIQIIILMGNSKVQFFYFNGSNPNCMNEQQCKNRLKSNCDQVTIDEATWTTYNLQQFIKQIDQWNLKRTLAVRKLTRFPIKSIQDIKFPYLINLSLGNNNIESIESLSRMWLPSIEVIDLGNNKIRNVGVLRRINYKKLRKIYLENNPFYQINKLSQIDFKNLKIELYLSKQICIDWSFKNQARFQYSTIDDFLCNCSTGHRGFLMVSLMLY